ncbi:MFS transporter [Ilumatobacter sp.]|uniref:MFS transporter n=1 Tax=Ilumatobacter sp. TaxID=1967498 RepID=UPI003B5303BC
MDRRLEGRGDRASDRARARRDGPPLSRFTRLAVTHALMMAGDAAMVVALADSIFFSVDLDAARTQVMLFLGVSFAPFLVIAPLIGPWIDRISGGRRLVVQIVAAVRVVLMALMAVNVDGFALFPLVFASLVLQKTYTVCKSALVPSTVRSEAELVEANSKLGLVSGITGAVAVVPAGILLTVVGPPAALLYGAALFAAGAVSSRRLAPEVVAPADDDAEGELASPSLRLATVVMTVLRANVGFTFFHLAFWLRTEDGGTILFALAVGASAVATMAGNALAPRIRSALREESMLSGALVLGAAAGLGLAVLGEPVAGILVAAVVNFAAAIGRLAFESVVQRDAPGANHGRAFATFETRFQFAWAGAAFTAVAIRAPGAVGLAVVGITSALALVHLQLGERSPVHRALSTRRRRRSIGRRTSSAAPRRAGTDRPAAPRDDGARTTGSAERSVSRRPGEGRGPGSRRPARRERATGPGPRSRSASAKRRRR